MDYDIFIPKYSKYSEADFEDDQYAVQIAINAANQLLHDARITPQQIVGLGHALYALQRFPVATPGVDVQFGVVVDGKDRSEYFNFHISGDMFQISQGGYIDMGAGYDSYSLEGWHIECSGFREVTGDLFRIEDKVAVWLNNDATEISVTDMSDMTPFDFEAAEQNTLNYHTLNQKAKALLQTCPNSKPLTDELYIHQLMHFGLQNMNERMRLKRQEIRSQHLMQHLEAKVKTLRLDMTDPEFMSWFIQNNDPIPLLEIDDLIEGATTALWIVIKRILIDLSEHIQDTNLTPQRQVSLFDTNP